jgi:hypothetical protein
LLSQQDSIQTDFHPLREDDPLILKLTSRFFGLLLLTGALAVFSSSCGLQDYEKQLEEQQARLKYTEEENTHLDPKPVKLFEKKEKEKPKGKEKDKDDEDKDQSFHPDSFFMRAPAGITPVPDEKPVGILGHYPARSESGAIREMFVAAAKTDNRDKFKSDVLKEFKVGKSPRTMSVERLGYKQQFEYYQDETGSTRVYFNQGTGGIQVAVAFRLASGTAPTAATENKIIYCLQSVATGNMATQMHKTYKPTRKGK